MSRSCKRCDKMEERAGVMLIAAAGAGNLTLLKHMSLVFENVKGESYHERALLSAVLSGRIEAVKMLLEMGVDPRAEECIWAAEYWGHKAILTELTHCTKIEYNI